MLLRWLILVTLFSTKSFAQDTVVRPKNAVFAEINISHYLDYGGWAAINYERVVFQTNKLFFTSTIGIGLLSSQGGYYESDFALPHSFSVNIGSRKSYLELGVKGIYTRLQTYRWGNPSNKYKYYDEDNYLINPVVGYKFIAANRPYFKIFYGPIIPIVGYAYDFTIISGGFAAGYAF